jgi:hypothetical protein
MAQLIADFIHTNIIKVKDFEELYSSFEENVGRKWNWDKIPPFVSNFFIDLNSFQ